MLGEFHDISNPALVYELTEQVVMERLRREGIFRDAPDVTTIGLMGYSWGGGTVIKLSEAIHVSPYSGTIPMHMAILDAVEVGSIYAGKPAGYYRDKEYRPPVRSLFNRYQEHSPATQENAMRNEFLVGMNHILPSRTPRKNDLALLLEKVLSMGYPAHGRAYGKLTADDQESLGLEEDHFTIDNSNIHDIETLPDGSHGRQNALLLDEAKNFIREKLSNQ